MKILIAISMLLVLSACSKEIEEGTIGTHKVIPTRNQEAASQFVARQMESIKVTNRGEDEDLEDFLEQAMDNAIVIYGVDSIGVWKNGAWTPYPYCSRYMKRQIDLRVNSFETQQ